MNEPSQTTNKILGSQIIIIGVGLLGLFFGALPIQERIYAHFIHSILLLGLCIMHLRLVYNKLSFYNK